MIGGTRFSRSRLVLVALVWVLATALRVGFVLRLPDLPLYWDENYYEAGSTLYAQAWQSILKPVELPTPFRTAFLTSLQKGEAYNAFAGAVYALAGPRPRTVFVVQALLDGGTCLFVYGIANVLAGPPAGLAALALAAVYPPFVFAAGRLQSETFAAFLCTGALWAFLRPWRRREWLSVGCSGLLLALAMLARPAFQFLFFLWLPLAVRRSVGPMNPLLAGTVDFRNGNGSLPLKKGGQEGFEDESFDKISLAPPFSKGEVDAMRPGVHLSTARLSMSQVLRCWTRRGVARWRRKQPGAVPRADEALPSWGARPEARRAPTALSPERAAIRQPRAAPWAEGPHEPGRNRRCLARENLGKDELVRRGTLRRLARCAAFAAGFFLLIGPRLVVTDRVVGRPLWSGTTDPSINSYAGIVFDNLGWRTDHLAFNRLGELPAVLQERGHAEPHMDDYRLATRRTWERHPFKSAAVLLHKAYVVWRHPYNDSRRVSLLSERGQRWLHQGVLILAAIGLPLMVQNRRAGVPLALTILYMWAIYFAVQIEVRYMVTAFPLLICAAAVALTLLGRGWRAAWRADQARRLWVPVLLLLGLVLFLRGATIGRLVAPPFALSPLGAYNVHRGLAMLVMLDLAALAAMLLRRAPARRWALAAAFPCLVAAPTFLVGGALANLWHQWVCPLTSGDVVRQDFLLPPGLPPAARAEVRLDLSGYGSGPQDVVVTLNGVEAARFTGGPTRDNAVAPEQFYQQIFAGQGRGPRPWHGWYAVPVAPALLAGTQQLRVEARVEGGPHRTSGVLVFGDYDLGGGVVYDGPSPISPGSFADTSVYKYLGDGDFRMRRQYPFSGTSSSSYFDGRQWNAADLSPSPGRQVGRYRIVLRLVYPSGQALIF